jgi:hypothetical protein
LLPVPNTFFEVLPLLLPMALSRAAPVAPSEEDLPRGTRREGRRTMRAFSAEVGPNDNVARSY